ncbi:TPA: glycosyltransferase family 1 protein [Klebsiella variicola]|nr:glycosyltransferase family 1 protein [Klebsiella variicola]
MIYVNARFLTQKLTGVQRFAIEISKSLVSKRNDLVFLVPNLDDILYSEDIKDFNLQEIKGFSGHTWEQITLPIFLKNKKAKLINLTNTAPCFYKNQIVTHHDITYIRYPESFSSSFRLAYKLFPRFFLKNNVGILTVSEFSKKEISKEYNIDEERLNVIYNAVGDKFLKKNIGVDEKIIKEQYFLTVSSTAYHKNFHGLIKAFVRTNLDYKLKIVGGSDKIFPQGNIDKLDNRIEMLGRVTDEELIFLYQNATAFIFPSLYEGFGIPPLEAQAVGCPVISSDQASMPEVLGDSVIYFNPYSIDDIIDKLEFFVLKYDEKNKLIDKGFYNVDRFSWEQSAEKIDLLLKKLNW